MQIETPLSDISDASLRSLLRQQDTSAALRTAAQAELERRRQTLSPTPHTMLHNTTTPMAPSRFGILRTMSVVYQVLAWTSLIITVSLFILNIMLGTVLTRELGLGIVVSSLLILVMGVINFVVPMTAAQALTALVDTERQTRQVQQDLKRVTELLESRS